MDLDFKKIKKTSWHILRSPKTKAILSFGIAVISLVHAVEGVVNSVKGTKVDDDDADDE